MHPPGTGWAHTQDVQKLFWDGTLQMRCTLAEPEECRKTTQTHSYIEKLNAYLKNSFAPTCDWLGAHSRCPETILGWYTRQ